MEIGPKGIEIIKHFESCCLKSYPDPVTKAEPYTIGWGSTYYADGSKVQLGQIISQDEADILFKKTLKTYVDSVNSNIKCATTQNQFDSMVSLCYNIGPANFGRSSVIKAHNQKPGDKLVGTAFLLWNKSKGIVIKGLTTRRNAESDLYLSE